MKFYFLVLFIFFLPVIAHSEECIPSYTGPINYSNQVVSNITLALEPWGLNALAVGGSTSHRFVVNGPNSIYETWVIRSTTSYYTRSQQYIFDFCGESPSCEMPYYSEIGSEIPSDCIPKLGPDTCSNGYQDGDEIGDDCGGSCSAPCVPSCPDDYNMSTITVGDTAFHECYRIVPDDGIGNCPNDYTYIDGGDCINKIPPLLSAGEVYIAPEGNPWNNADNSSLPSGLPPSPSTDTTTTESSSPSITTNSDGSTTTTDTTTTTNSDGSTTTTTTTTTTNADGSTSTSETTATTGPTSGASGEWQDQWERTSETQTGILRETGEELTEQTGVLKGIADFLEGITDKLAWWEEDHPFNPGSVFPSDPVIDLDSETPTIAPEFLTEPDWEALETEVKSNSLVELAEDAEITLSGAYCSISSPLKIGSTDTTQTVDFCHWEEFLRKLGVIIMFFSYVCGIVYLARR